MKDKKDLIGSYFVKKVIAEVRHHPILTHSTLLRQKLSNSIKLFDKVTVSKLKGVEESFQCYNSKEYYELLSEWTRTAFTVENSESIENAAEKIKKVFNPILSEIGISEYKRIGLRVVFLIPFEDAFENLVKYYNDKVYKDIKLFDSYGTVEDVGVSALTIKDQNYKMNFTFGPFQKNEIKVKISEFKDFEDLFNCAFMIDIDLYDDALKSYKIGSFFIEALEAARLKTVKFREKLLN